MSVSSSTRSPSPVGRTTHNVMAAVLSTEERLAARIASAAREAEVLIADARAAAQQTDDACDAEIETRTRALLARHDARARADLAAIAAQAERTVARYDAIDEARIRELARLAVIRVLRVEPTGGSGTR